MRRLLSIATVLALAGCVTPSIPIPPPSPEQMTFDVDLDTGVATFEYPPNGQYADAIVYVYNRDAEEGIITTARGDGSVGPTDPFPAAYGDEVTVTMETDDAVASTCIVLTDAGARPNCSY